MDKEDENGQDDLEEDSRHDEEDDVDECIEIGAVPGTSVLLSGDREPEIMSAQVRTSQNFFPPEIDSDTNEPPDVRRSGRLSIRTREKEQNRMSYM